MAWIGSILNGIFAPTRPVKVAASPSASSRSADPQAGWPDDGELFRVSPHDPITRRDLYEGAAIFGQIGSGKTSGSGAMILSSLIADGWGGFIATTKPGEAAAIKAICAKLGRSHDVIHVSPEPVQGVKHFFNWLQWEQERSGPGVGISMNTAETLTTFTSFIRPEQTLHASDNAHFFQENATRWFIEAIDLIALAGATPELDLLAEIIGAAPEQETDLKSDAFAKSSLKLLLTEAARRAENAAGIEGEKLRQRQRRVANFWQREVFRGSDRTQRDIGLTLQTSLFRLQQDPIRDLIASERGCSFVPEAVEVGGLILFDAPAMVFGPAGRFLTRMHKLLFQQTMSRRTNVTHRTRPVFLYADEAQSYLVPGDADYQALCRDRRAATVYLSQNLDNYTAVMGSRARAEQLLANLTLKIFHANSGTTNEWASHLIASAWQDVTSTSFGGRGQGAGQDHTTHNTNVSPQVHPQVLAAEFTRLRTGGPTGARCVDAVVFKPGRRFALSGGPHLRSTFIQGEP